MHPDRIYLAHDGLREIQLYREVGGTIEVSRPSNFGK